MLKDKINLLMTSTNNIIVVFFSDFFYLVENSFVKIKETKTFIMSSDATKTTRYDIFVISRYTRYEV